VIEHSFVSAVPTGLVFFVNTNVGIQQALWIECGIKRIQRQIRRLRKRMWSLGEYVRVTHVSQGEPEQIGPSMTIEQLQK
jgi:hypothetical protein